MAVLRIVYFFVIPIVTAFYHPWIASLKGGSRAVCKRSVSYMGRTEKTDIFGQPSGHLYHGFSIWSDYDEDQEERYEVEWRIEEYCCPGYKNNNGTCEPLCSSQCINGYCAEPYQCVCNDGYEFVKAHQCDPICNETCVNGKCTGPNTCTCNTGYKLNADGHICEPECISECKHGWCEQPNVCACHPGYSMKNDTKEGQTCVPICDKSCENGECVAPNTCSCNNGFEQSHIDASVCLPRCQQNCISGNCTAPETCTCDDGHKLNITNKYHCEPVCSSVCNNGYCAEPNVCACNPGFEKNGTEECRPICDRPCVNGKCVAPDVCTCNDGFQHSHNDAFNCEPICSDPCVFGSCTAPGVCTCNSGYKISPDANTTCVPICNETCPFGICIAPNRCDCSFGFGGDSCEKKLFCVITQPKGLNSTKLLSNVTELDEIEITRGDPQLDWKDPECDSKCLDRLDNMTVNFAQSSADLIRYFVPIDSSCNIVKDYSSFWQKKSSVIGAVVGIAFLAMVVCALYVMRMKRKPMNSEFTQRLVTDYVEVDQIE